MRESPVPCPVALRPRRGARAAGGGRFLLALVSTLAASESAFALEEGAPVKAAPALRREGLWFGLSAGLAVASASGYRNDVTEIGLPEFEASTGAAASGGGAAWLGGSLVDWLNVGVGLQSVSFKGNGLEASGFGLNVRVEAFPLFYRGGPWQDLGLSLLAGTGGVDVQRAGDTVAQGEATSLVGAGVFFEPWRFWHFSTGPDLSYTHQFSRSMSAHLLVVGWRLAFYGGP
jgi:hypothetical protein